MSIWPAFALAFLLALPVPTAPLTPSILASGAVNCPDGCWTIHGSPAYVFDGHRYTVTVTYYSSFNINVTGTVYLVIQNSLGQTVATDSTTTTIPPGKNETLHPTVSGLLPPGTYSTFIFATTAGGVSISTTTSGSFKSTYSLEFQSFATGSGVGLVGTKIVFRNVSPEIVQGILKGSVNDTAGHFISSVAMNVTVPANSEITEQLIFPGTTNISICFLDFTFDVLSPNETSLMARDHESADCPGFGFPMTPPMTVTLGSLQALKTNITNVAPFPVTLVIIGQMQNLKRTMSQTTSSTVSLGAGQSATAYLILATMPCGSYVTLISNVWIDPSPVPPFIPQFSTATFVAQVTTC